MDYEQLVAQWRADKAKYVAEQLAPYLNPDFGRLAYFPIVQEWRVVAHLASAGGATPYVAPTSSGDVREFLLHSVASFELEGETHSLQLFTSRDEPLSLRLFLPFTDATSGATTYGGGRYLDPVLSDPTADSLVLDFNYCYQPYCAYAEGFSCALPPAENRLRIAVTAGERLPLPRQV